MQRKRYPCPHAALLRLVDFLRDHNDYGDYDYDYDYDNDNDNDYDNDNDLENDSGKHLGSGEIVAARCPINSSGCEWAPESARPAGRRRFPRLSPEWT